MKLKVGMYVRTKSFKGFPSKIGKITKIEYNAGINNETYIALDNDEEKCRRWTEDWLIGKPSFNPVDLIEVGDYVNGYKVSAIYNPNGDEIVNIHLIMEYGYETINTYIDDYSINSIVTKEQFESMSYEVEG